MTTPETIELRRTVADLSDRADAAFEAGDYRVSGALDTEAAALVTDPELKARLIARHEAVGWERVAIYSGLFGLALYLAAWAFALW